MVLSEDMSLLAMTSLYKEKGNDGYLWSEALTFNVVCYGDILFPKVKKLKLSIVCITLCALFFQTRLFSANMLAVR